MSNYVSVTNVADLKYFIKNKNVVVDYGAKWCGPCKRIQPLFKKLSEQYPNIIFASIDVDDFDGSTPQSVPTFKFYKDGNLANEMVGADGEKLISYVQELDTNPSTNIIKQLENIKSKLDHDVVNDILTTSFKTIIAKTNTGCDEKLWEMLDNIKLSSNARIDILNIMFNDIGNRLKRSQNN